MFSIWRPSFAFEDECTQCKKAVLSFGVNSNWRMRPDSNRRRPRQTRSVS